VLPLYSQREVARANNCFFMVTLLQRIVLKLDIKIA
jgi:hypothetical protein